MYYFITNVPEEAILTANCDVDQIVPYNINDHLGHLVPTELASFLADDFGCTITQEVPSDFENITWATMTVGNPEGSGAVELTTVSSEDGETVVEIPTTPQRRISFHGYNNSIRDAEAWKIPIREKLVPVVDKSVRFEYTRGYPSALAHGLTSFPIYVYSRPKMPRDVDIPPTQRGWRGSLFGVSITGALIAPSQNINSYMLIDDGVIVGEVYKNCMFLFVCLHPETIREATVPAVLSSILDLALVYLSATEEEQLALIKDQLAFNNEGIKTDFIAACTASNERRLADLEHREADLRASSRDYLQRLTAVTEDLSNVHLEKELHAGTGEKLQEQMLSDLDALNNHERISNLKLTRNRIIFQTPELTCQDPRTEIVHIIGHMEITLNFSGDGRHQILWKNLDRKVAGHHAPHVFGGGDACLGNASETIVELMAGKRILELAEFAICFCEDVNTADSVGREINRWPIAPGQEDLLTSLGLDPAAETASRLTLDQRDPRPRV